MKMLTGKGEVYILWRGGGVAGGSGEEWSEKITGMKRKQGKRPLYSANILIQCL